MVLATLAGLGAAWVFLAQALAEPPLAWPPWAAFLVALAFLLAAGWVGWAFRQAWIYPRTLRRAEVLWDDGGPPEGVEAILNGALLGRGELGYRIHLLRGKALLAQGRRDEAWASFLHGELARLPLPARWLVAPVFRRRPGRDRHRQLVSATRLMAVAPRMAHLHQLAAALRMEDPQARPAAFALLRESLKLGAEDPLLLEDTMLAALAEGDDPLAEDALAALLSRHQDPRLLWNRAAAVAILLRLDRPAEAVALAARVPEERRTGPELWALEASARRRLGDLDGADAVLGRGLAKHPGDFRLWMESHALAMQDRAHDDAFSDLEEARNCLDGSAPSQRWEWELRRAEFAWWVDGDADTARLHLSRVPLEHQGSQVPPLRLHLQAAAGDPAAVLEELDRPGSVRNPASQFLRAECLAGLRDWEALAACLGGMDEEAQEHPEFRHFRGILCAHTRRLPEAREEMERAAVMDPQNLRYILDAGHACADLGEWERSEGHWQRALQLEGSCAEALLELAESRLAMQDRPGAVRFLRECLLHHPEDPEAQLRLAELESN